MEKTRAQEISSSPDMANVTYNGTRIYIENVNDGNSSANVHALSNPSKTIEVPLTSLIEH